MKPRYTEGIPPDAYRIDDNGCWIWLRAADQWGYGRIRRGSKVWLAHRYSWTLANGPIVPSDLTVDHMCFVPACINPAHMRLLTLSENAQSNRVLLSPTCRNGHRRDIPGSVRVTTGPNGHPFRRCIPCERIAGAKARQARKEKAA